MILLFLGLPGCGKGTIARYLVKRFGIVQISSGDILRASIQLGLPLGNEAKEYVDMGMLVPDDIINSVIKERISQDDCRNGFILDGYPRTIGQAQALSKMNVNLDHVIHLSVSKDRIVDRLSGRRICSQCGDIYNISSKKPKEDGVCDLCGGTLYQRADDKPSAIRQRLDIHAKETLPLINFYRKEGLLKEADGNAPSDEVFERVFKVIK